MPSFDVTMPFAGFLFIRVDAETEQAAIDKALGLDVSLTPSGDPAAEMGEWAMLPEITRGNILYAPLNEASATQFGGGE